MSLTSFCTADSRWSGKYPSCARGLLVRSLLLPLSVRVKTAALALRCAEASSPSGCASKLFVVFSSSSLHIFPTNNPNHSVSKRQYQSWNARGRVQCPLYGNKLTCTLHDALPKHAALPLRPAVADLMQLNEQLAEPASATGALRHVRPATLFERARVVSRDHAVDVRESSLLYCFQYRRQATRVP